jgi:hypothetical protein
VEAVGELRPLDGRDHEGEDLDPLPLAPGAKVQVSGWLRPPCDGANREVTLSVHAKDAVGDKSTLRFSARNVEAVEAAMREFCELGPTVTLMSSRLEPNGDAAIGLDVVNPGPHQITVEVPAYSDKYVTWAAAQATIPSGASVRLEIQGTQVDCEPGETASWLKGRLLLDGAPFTMTSDDGWC